MAERRWLPNPLHVMATLAIGFLLGLWLAAVHPLSASALGCSSVTFNLTQGNDDFADGSDNSATIYAMDGKDQVSGDDCGDSLYGGLESDGLHGETGNDLVKGEAGHDNPNVCTPPPGCAGLHGGDGNDDIYGGDGPDRLEDETSGTDSDSLFGEDGDDALRSQDGDNSDFLDGGAPVAPNETDTCSRDSGDTKTSCA
jgi:Ca2+-binding RTX toxin-like protein